MKDAKKREEVPRQPENSKQEFTGMYQKIDRYKKAHGSSSPNDRNIELKR